MLVLLTVGSTRFDGLIQTALSVPVLRALHGRKYRNLIVQCGTSNFELASSLRDSTVLTLNREGVDIELWTFKPSLQAEYCRADLVISHAGSGTILDVLRLGKPLIVVPNTTLLNDHQQELASSLAEMGHLVASTATDLAQAIEELDTTKLMPFPALDTTRFRDLLDEEMGYAL